MLAKKCESSFSQYAYSALYCPYDPEFYKVRFLQRLEGCLPCHEALEEFGKKWNDKYPMIQASWERNWNNLTEFFNYPEDIRRAIYTGDWLLISLQFYLTGVFPALINPCHLHTFYDRVYGQQFTMVFYFISASLFQAETVQFLYTGFLYRPAKVLYHL